MKQISKLLLILFAAVTLVSCGTENKPGEISVYYNSYSGGIDTTLVYDEGFHFHAPWADHIQSNKQLQIKEYTSKVLDKNGTGVSADVKVTYRIQKQDLPKIITNIGPDYVAKVVDPNVKGAIRSVIGKYTYKELYGAKRDIIKAEIEEMLRQEFSENYIILGDVEVADIDIPTNIREEIEAKERQRERNLRTDLLKEEKTNIAEANEIEAEGAKRVKILKAEADAEEIRVKQQQLSSNPMYIRLLEAQAQNKFADGVYKNGLGSNNIFGSETFVMKNMSVNK